ncbi:N-acetylmuramoyl-L-alanine amidase [uncultured Clostridium sp.]|jgi:N-acetylmuramoyl-L-alanine amidase|uniref:N-acetylmuramoyl-L-alanine amidase n=2 Tax=uncultured Clostridium sp. TaxID=59620 RepID=UPI002603EDE2|nr:N-acetylmuramoyl-L-alanine amidase [uncultured Clostridium sp.]
MNIFLTGGHPMYGGAKGILDETIVDRAIVKELDIVLREMGHNVTVFNSEATNDYVEETKKANAGNYDWYLDVHLNASTGSGHGVETLVYSTIYKEATSITNNISNLGFTNRGVKPREDLYILKNTKMKALLIECFFIDNKNDCDLYARLGARKIAIAIAEGLTGQVYRENTNNNGETYYRCIAGSFKEKSNAEKRKRELEEKGFTGVFLEAFKK